MTPPTTPILNDLVSLVVDRTMTLAQIPAPPHHEELRSRLVREWWLSDGLDDVHVDEVGNVWGTVRHGPGPRVLVCAHLDTVFGHDMPHTVQRIGSRIFGPSVGDDCLAVASLSLLDVLLPSDLRAHVSTVATVGEEGVGNLRGIRHALGLATDTSAVVAIEGNYLGRISRVGVGSIRLRLLVRGPGGHAWEAATAPSATHECARLISSLTQLAYEDARCSINVGRMGGGEAINARARRAWAEIDLRSEEPAALTWLSKRIDEIITDGSREGLEVSLEPIGHRPAGELDPEHPLVLAASAALMELWGPPQFVATSTDANAAHAVGIPAIALGITEGGAEHTPGEWIEVHPIGIGLETLAATISAYVEAVQ